MLLIFPEDFGLLYTWSWGKQREWATSSGHWPGAYHAINLLHPLHRTNPGEIWGLNLKLLESRRIFVNAFSSLPSTKPVNVYLHFCSLVHGPLCLSLCHFSRWFPRPAHQVVLTCYIGLSLPQPPFVTWLSMTNSHNPFQLQLHLSAIHNPNSDFVFTKKKSPKIREGEKLQY